MTSSNKRVLNNENILHLKIKKNWEIKIFDEFQITYWYILKKENDYFYRIILQLAVIAIN